MSSYILNKSKLYDEIKDMPGALEKTLPLVTNTVVHELNNIKWVELSDLFQYTRAMNNGYINRHLNYFSIKELKEAYELLEFWQLPKVWSTTVAEEIAFKEFLDIWEKVEVNDDDDVYPYDYLPPILREKADEIGSRVCVEDGPIDSGIVFSYGTMDPLVEYLLGRSDEENAHLEEWYPLNYVIDEIIIASGYVDMLELLVCQRYVSDKQTAKYARIAVECGHLNILKDIYYRHHYWNWKKCLFIAQTRRHQHIIDWIMSVPKKELPYPLFGD
jgi:hypothetical protein